MVLGYQDTPEAPREAGSPTGPGYSTRGDRCSWGRTGGRIQAREAAPSFPRRFFPLRTIGQEIGAGADGIVIGHGTDTMGHTAAILSFMVQNSPVPIVLVGVVGVALQGWWIWNYWIILGLHPDVQFP